MKQVFINTCIMTAEYSNNVVNMTLPMCIVFIVYIIISKYYCVYNEIGALLLPFM